MSAQRRKIQRAVEAKGYKLVTLTWEPWGASVEKSGIPGGWYGTVAPDYSDYIFPGNEIMGLSVADVLAWIDEFVPARAGETPADGK